jgi:hypothetical protein
MSVVDQTSASDVNNLGVDWFRAGDISCAFHFFYNSIERFKNGKNTVRPNTNQTDCDTSRSLVESSSSSATSTPISQARRLQVLYNNIHNDQQLFREQFYCCPIKIVHTSTADFDPPSRNPYYFSSEPTADYIICSCIAVFNMALAVHAMDDACAARNQINNRLDKVKTLFEHCLQLLAIVFDPIMKNNGVTLSSWETSRSSPPYLNENKAGIAGITASDSTVTSPVTPFTCVALATCDLITMACLNNLIVLDADNEPHNTDGRRGYMEMLLFKVATIRPERYGHDQEVLDTMTRLADMFLITVFFIIKFLPGPAAAAA